MRLVARLSRVHGRCSLEKSEPSCREPAILCGTNRQADPPGFNCRRGPKSKKRLVFGDRMQNQYFTTARWYKMGLRMPAHMSR